jgi:hypothetical protein
VDANISIETDGNINVNKANGLSTSNGNGNVNSQASANASETGKANANENATPLLKENLVVAKEKGASTINATKTKMTEAATDAKSKVGSEAKLLHKQKRMLLLNLVLR